MTPQAAYQPPSIVAILAAFPPDERGALLDSLPDDLKTAILHSHNDGPEARRGQRAPVGDWDFFLLLGGRGSGKTHALVKTISDYAESNQHKQMALLVPTVADFVGTIIDGPSGFESLPRWMRPKFESTNRRLVWPNGTILRLFSAEKPERMRGPGVSVCFVDEIAAFSDPDAAMAQAHLILRELSIDGCEPQMVIATTPCPVLSLQKLATHPRAFVSVSRTDANTHLPESYAARIRENMAVGQSTESELEGRFSFNDGDMMWNPTVFRYNPDLTERDCSVVVVSVDPANGGNDTSGIVAMGLLRDSDPPRFVVLEDASTRAGSAGWPAVVANAFTRNRASAVILEAQQGDTHRQLLANVAPLLPVVEVSASRSKEERAAPCAQAYELGRVVHRVPFPHLESQACQMSATGFLGSGSPDRVDALSHGYRFLATAAARRRAPMVGGSSATSRSKFVGQAG